jgi:mannose-6-phosphate isomerase-like protein (cupin superfamily)
MSDAPVPEGLFAERLAGGEIELQAFVVAEWSDPGGGSDPPLYVAPLHVHHDDDEAWYVLEGTLAVRLDGRDVEVPAGGAVIAPRGTPHTYWNPRPGPLRYLLVMTPQISRMIEALHALAEPDEGAVAALFADHGSKYLGWPS